MFFFIFQLTWAEFQQVADRDPQSVEDAIKALNAGLYSSLSSRPNAVYGSGEYLTVQDNKFPTAYKDSRNLHKLSEMYNPFTMPPIRVSSDIDSIYTVSHDPECLIRALGDNPFSIHSLTNPMTAETGSRFSVNTKKCKPPIQVRGGKISTCPLNWFPNVRIATCKIPNLKCAVMYINIYYIGSDVSVGKSNYFSTLMMGVVNAMVNISRNGLNKNPATDIEPSVLAELRGLENLHTKISSKDKSKGVTSTLSPQAMLLLVSVFEMSLGFISDEVPSIPFETTFYNGIQSKDPSQDKSLPRGKMASFARKLKDNMLFTASVAGCKSCFYGSEYDKLVTIDPIIMNQYRMKQNQLGDSFDPNVHLENYPEEWYFELNKALSQARNELKDVAMEVFREAFRTPHLPGEATISDQEEELSEEHQHEEMRLGDETSGGEQSREGDRLEHTNVNFEELPTERIRGGGGGRLAGHAGKRSRPQNPNQKQSRQGRGRPHLPTQRSNQQNTEMKQDHDVSGDRAVNESKGQSSDDESPEVPPPPQEMNLLEERPHEANNDQSNDDSQEDADDEHGNKEDEEQIPDDEESPLFLDIGFVVTLEGAETFIYGELNGNERIVKSQMTQR